jgi:hypothetical protein
LRPRDWRSAIGCRVWTRWTKAHRPRREFQVLIIGPNTAVRMRVDPRVGCSLAGQVSPTARQLGPGLGFTGPPPIKVFPFMSQIEAWPVLAFCHRMSELPSPLKSPVPISVQLDPGLGLTAPPSTKVVPFISQIAAWPFVFCHKRAAKAGRLAVVSVIAFAPLTCPSVPSPLEPPVPRPCAPPSSAGRMS